MSTELKLEAKNPTEQRVLDYLKENVSEVLAEKINAGKKTIAGAMGYCKGEAQKLAAGESCAYVDDATVFGWIIHYFEEDTITEKEKASAVKLPSGVSVKPKKRSAELKKVMEKKITPKTEKPPKATKPAKPVKPEPQLTMFEALLGGGT